MHRTRSPIWSRAKYTAEVCEDASQLLHDVCNDVCSADGSSTGYIRLVVFSQNAAADVQHAVQTLQQEVAFFCVLGVLSTELSCHALPQALPIKCSQEVFAFKQSC